MRYLLLIAMISLSGCATSYGLGGHLPDSYYVDGSAMYYKEGATPEATMIDFYDCKQMSGAVMAPQTENCMRIHGYTLSSHL